MWQEAQLVAHHPKWPGIVGDSLTFAGAILLALEALFKPAEKVSIGRKATIINYFKYAENAEGQKLDLADVEREWTTLWTACNRAGAFALVIGFAFLLATRLFAE
jgi:hypothetical protein